MLLFYLVAVLPISLLVVLGTAVVCRIRKIPMPRTLCWPDALALVLIPVVWAAVFEHVGTPKSLANLVELIYLGWFWCLCILVRYILAAKAKLRPQPGAWLTLLLVLSATILSAIFFPCLPE